MMHFTHRASGRMKATYQIGFFVGAVEITKLLVRYSSSGYGFSVGDRLTRKAVDTFVRDRLREFGTDSYEDWWEEDWDETTLHAAYLWAFEVVRATLPEAVDDDFRTLTARFPQQQMDQQQPAPTITISLSIENTYQTARMSLDSATVRSTVTDEVVPAPPPEADGDAWEAWVDEEIRGRTGGDRPAGLPGELDSWHNVTVTACSDPDLVGRTFDFGY
jgi:hypothetical protein